MLWRGLGSAVWGQSEGLGNSVPWARERKARAQGTQKEVWACRRSKAPLLQRARGGGAGRGASCEVYRQWGQNTTVYGNARSLTH